MLPLHFELFSSVFYRKGYKMVFLKDDGRNMADVGIRYVHNDMCYPAILVIGQLIDALKSGKYDVNKVALLIMQTGGGCRASNYLSILRKALKRVGYPNVPVVSLNVAGLEKNPGFNISVPTYGELSKCVILGDLIMLLRNQCKIREINKGETEKLTEKWMVALTSKMIKGKLSSYEFKTIMQEVVADFSKIERKSDPVVRVGIVGEIYVKYSSLGNNNLEKFLYKEGVEVTVPGFIDFCIYCVYNNVLDNKLYGMSKINAFVWQWVTNYLEKEKNEMISVIEKDGHFQPPSSFKHITTLPQSSACVSLGMKMGEGWLLTAEMLELYEMGIKNIVCTQPFGCLPNHIVGKGMMRPIKKLYPDVNIVAIDYDPGASKINQENRLKLMLANAKKNK
jgi:predicted nucleotide-binding protein (sugar kinase/HSP70/actin superfamily)